MVYPDFTDQNLQNKKLIITPSSQPANVLQRLFAVLLDYFILSPVISFFIVIIFADGLRLYQQFPDSSEAKIILFQIAIGFVFLFTLIQAVFIFFSMGTPGQIFTKTYIRFEQNNLNLFFQAWLRQVGFMVSVLLLGIPFLAIFYHPNRRTIYERMTESTVLTKAQSTVDFFTSNQAEHRYISVFVSTFLLFFMFLSVFSFKNFYNQTLISNLTFQSSVAKKQFCEELSGVKQENRLIVATALNLLGVLPDRCLDLEADFVLWKNFSKDVGTYSKPDAYFAKYLTAENEEDENKYLRQSCDENSQADACRYAEAFLVGDFDLLNEKIKSIEQNILSDVLKYEIAHQSGKDITKSLDELEKYTTLKLMNKYVITERLNKLQQMNLKPTSASRSIASEGEKEFLDQIKKIKSRIDDL